MPNPMFTVRTDSRYNPPTNSGCSGTYESTEYAVWLNDELIIDERGTGYACFESEQHAIETAKHVWWLEFHNNNNNPKEQS